MVTVKNIIEIRTGWNEAVKTQRCFHALAGRAPEHKICANGYACGTCPFDQMLEDMRFEHGPVFVGQSVVKAA